MSWFNSAPKPVPKTGELVEIFNSQTKEYIGMFLVVDDNFTSKDISFYEVKGNQENGKFSAPKNWFEQHPNSWRKV